MRVRSSLSSALSVRVPLSIHLQPRARFPHTGETDGPAAGLQFGPSGWSQQLRSFLAALLILLGALPPIPSSLAFWEQRVLMDEERFVQLARDILGQEAVQERLGAPIGGGGARPGGQR